MSDYSSTADTASDSMAMYFRPVVEDPVVVLVDESDREIGTARKLAAHQSGGVLHRAFSVFLFDSGDHVLLQKRAVEKYHFGGLWTNACCGHAVPGEDLALTAAIRLWQEMRICVALKEVGVFTYSARDEGSGLTEREIDHVFVGVTADSPQPDPSEADAWQWTFDADVRCLLETRSEAFTPWFEPAFALARPTSRSCGHRAKLSEKT